MINNILSSILHSKLRVLLILFLSEITFFLVLLTFTNSLAFNTQIKMVEAMFSSDLTTTYRIDVSYIEDFDNSGVALAELKEFVNQEIGGKCGAYDQSGEYFDELQNNVEYISLNERAYSDTFRSDTPSIAECVFFDTEILPIVSTELSEDDFQLLKKGDETYLPLYVGKDFEHVLAIGDTLTLSRNGAKYIVAGYLDDIQWFDDSDPITLPVISLNHKFFAPFADMDKIDSITQQSTVGKIFIENSDNVQGFSDIVSEKALQLGIKLRITSINDFVEQWTQDNYQILKLNFFLAVIVLICSVISMISTLCVTVLLQKREYGIRIAFGTSKRKIIILLCSEILIINIVAGIIAFLYSYYNYAKSTIDSFQDIYIRTLCSDSLFGLIVIVFVLVGTVLFIPVIILSRYNPAELIKEED
ncbi:MAG: ABC transporter permease [Lachnospiraceae bacterium]|nr:ABC transporter permease [Lachnospiraceae bacterium]